MKAEHEIWTIGHSTRTMDEFLNILRSFDIELLADVRHYPGSKKFPHFNSDPLKEVVNGNGIGYILLTELGGRRKPNLNSLNTAWRNDSFRGYADYMETAMFNEGIEKLTKMALQKRTALMCSEAVWWRCHRSLISDHLKETDWKVMHIMKKDSANEHPFTAVYRLEHQLD